MFISMSVTVITLWRPDIRTPNETATEVNSVQVILFRIHVPRSADVNLARAHAYHPERGTYAIWPMLFEIAYSKLLLMSSGEQGVFFPPFLKTLPNELAIIVDLSPNLL